MIPVKCCALVQTLSKLQEHEFFCLGKKCKSTPDKLQTALCNFIVTCSSHIKRKTWYFMHTELTRLL